MVASFRSWESKICIISRINCCHYSANEMQDKTKLNSTGKVFHVSLTTNVTFFCKKYFNKQNQPDFDSKNNLQFLVLKGVKRKIANGSLAG